ncbi:MAG: diaminopimelate decarboxylase [Actinomycetota bacterium]|nr:diaminopimelate decarboxylase [Actinomycetota bacterium]
MLDVLPESAEVQDGALAVGGLAADELADRFGTPLVVYCEQTLRSDARAYVDAAPADALVAYSVKAFPNVALIRLFAGLGLGADVSTLGELVYALRGGMTPDRIVVHGNNKSDDELRAAAEADVGLLVIDAADDVPRAAAAGLRSVLVRVTPGIDVDTHPAIGTGYTGSKFGLPPDDAIEAIRRAREVGLETRGLHLHLGSQLLDAQAPRMGVDWLAGFAAECRAALGWTPAVVDVGGGLGIAHVDGERAPAIGDFVGALLARLQHAWRLHDLPPPRVLLEPGRSLVGRAAVTLYRVGVVKRASESTTYVAVDGGMSDNPRPQLYGARHAAVVTSRVGAEADGQYTVCGKHCESGDVLIERIGLPAPRRGDLLAVPATGAYTLGMGSNYNGVPRPGVVLVSRGEARVIRRRETVDDLLGLETNG